MSKNSRSGVRGTDYKVKCEGVWDRFNGDQETIVTIAQRGFIEGVY